MASHRIGETGSTHHPHPHHHLPYATTFINQEGSCFDYGELEEAIMVQEAKLRNDEAAKASLFSAPRPASATLEMFPSWPIRFHQTTRGDSRTESGGGGSGVKNSLSSSRSDKAESNTAKKQPQQDQMTSDKSHISKSAQDNNNNNNKRKGSTSDKPLDAKTLRRLAQNREAAKKSRLRKKAYVQQLESSRIKLSQLEHELQRARSQGLLLGGCNSGSNSNISSVFDMEYARWVEEDERQMSELRRGLQTQLGDGELRMIVDAYISHYDQIFELKGVAAKSDVFHLITGTWTSPAERCFLWMGGFRPSDLIKMLISQLDPLTEHQVMGICSLQHSSQQAEEALSQGLEQLQQSLIQTLANAPLLDAMQQMAIALNKLANLEGFLRQADNLRQQTLHQLRRILTVRQAARCFLVIGEYYGRLRALSTLWASRPRENMMSEETSCQTTSDLQMIQPSHNQFSNF